MRETEIRGERFERNLATEEPEVVTVVRGRGK